mmetsp:Transcript_33386/g.58592  ORF Transcript_33386/g.58592 Transcript_33386/m.58592 type:complete len:249 (-) Transcript_33386:100-846(-)|eukprot:CAMPEP_0201887044 /NCGR_PEP_ID=MMETSP0902-20130614/23922_1 /ASSEMBLY_ACC=CAM_ASM_000551 /TAXON_ID=420261 /ORGANISM="Thalassiosira antarctica, Strain CCMP982" /LENGTH=248 /DNA_ID=CAMNT_0048416831 /DNA_START=52 /DNA_END=798 /DNA_ORIENTATION=-
MKLIHVALSLVLAAPASAAYTIKKSIERDLDSFGEQAEAAKIKHLSTELVQHESHLRGSTAEEDTIVAVDRNTQWLNAHNDERKMWHDQEGYAYRPMKRSLDLEKNAEYWANELVLNCKSRSPPPGSGLVDYGWNIAGKQGLTEFRTVEEVFQLWNNKLYQGWPKNMEMSQVLWRATEYVGCADALADPASDKSCTFSVCFYARAGNCGMGSMNSWEDHKEKIMTSPACGPCPTDHDNCPENYEKPFA